MAVPSQVLMFVITSGLQAARDLLFHLLRQPRDGTSLKSASPPKFSLRLPSAIVKCIIVVLTNSHEQSGPFRT